MRKFIGFFTILLALFLTMLGATSAFGAITQGITKTTVASGNWSDLATWQTTPTTGTGAVNALAGKTAVTGTGTAFLTQGITSGDKIICGGVTATVLSVSTNTALTLTANTTWPGGAFTFSRFPANNSSKIDNVQVGAGLTLTNDASGSANVWDLIVPSGTTFTNNLALAMSSTSALSLDGTVNVNAAITAAKITSLTINGTTTLAAVLTPTVATAVTVNGILNVNAATTFAAATSITVGSAGAINCNAVLTNSTAADYTVNGTVDVKVAGGLTAGHNSTLSLSSTGTLKFDTPGTLVKITPTYNLDSTVEYYGGAQAVLVASYSKLILSGSGEKAMATEIRAKKSLSITGTAKASIAAGVTLKSTSLYLGGALQAYGTYGSTSSTATNVNDTYFAATTGTLANFAAITSTATGGTWATGTTWVGGVVPATDEDVIIAGPVTIGAAVTQTAEGSVAINSGALLTLGAGSIVPLF